MSGFLDLLRAFNGAAQGVTMVLKALQLVKSGQVIHGLATKQGALTKQEKIQLVAEIGVAVLNTADIAATGACLAGRGTSYAPLFKNIRMATSISAGIGSISKHSISLYFKEKVSQDDILNVVGVILFHVSDASGAACEEPKFNATVSVDTACETVQTISNVGSSALMTYSDRENLIEAALILKNSAINGAYIIATWAKKLLNPSKNTINCKPAPEPSTDKVPVLRPPPHVTTPEESGKHFDDVVKSMQNWEKLDQIPQECEHDSILQKFKCPITKKMVRFAASPSNKATVVYEKQVILKLLGAGEPPPKYWPKSLAFTIKNIKDNELAQQLINDALGNIAKDWSEVSKNIEKEKKKPAPAQPVAAAKKPAPAPKAAAAAAKKPAPVPKAAAAAANKAAAPAQNLSTTAKKPAPTPKVAAAANKAAAPTQQAAAANKLSPGWLKRDLKNFLKGMGIPF